MKLLAVFDLTELDDLSASLYNVETHELAGRVDDDPTDARPFQERVNAVAAESGHEVIEWDRSALSALP